MTHAGARPVFYDTYPDFRWRRASLEVALTPRTKGLVICNPGNPGGAVATEEELRAVVAFAREHHLWLLSDEAYGELVYDGAHCGIKRLAPEALLFGGFSKSHGIAGWRLGFVHGPAAVIEVLRHLQQFTATCAPTFAQRAMAPVLVEGNPEFRRHLRERRDLVVSILGDLLETPPQGGLFTFIPAPWGTGSEFSAACLRAGLVVVPGRSCSGRDTHIRLCFSAGLPQLRRGLDLLVEVARQEARG